MLSRSGGNHCNERKKCEKRNMEQPYRTIYQENILKL